MKTPTRNAALVAASCLFFAFAHAATQSAGSSGTAPAPGPVERASKAVARGAQATVSGVKRGTNAAVRGVKRGTQAAATGIARGAQATGQMVNKVAGKVGIGKSESPEAADGKP